MLELSELGEAEKPHEDSLRCQRNAPSSSERKNGKSGVAGSSTSSCPTPSLPGSRVVAGSVIAAIAPRPPRTPQVRGEPDQLERIASYLKAMNELEKRSQGVAREEVTPPPKGRGRGKGKKSEEETEQ